MTKDKGELFENVVLPGMPEPVPEPKRQPSKKDEDDEEKKITYQRYRAAKRALCDDCVQDQIEGKAKGIADAAYTRTFQSRSRYMCYAHAQSRRDQDHLEQL